PLRQAAEVADPVAVAVLERLDVKLVEDGVLVPELAHGLVVRRIGRSVTVIGERLARERRDAEDRRRKLGGGLRPPSETSPQESLRRQSRRSNLDRLTGAVLGHVRHLGKVSSTDRRTACARTARRGGWPPAPEGRAG